MLSIPAPLNGRYTLITHNPTQPPFKLWSKIHGTGPIKILFIMGLNTSHQNWSLQFEHFASLPDTNFSCLVFDNRGVGFSDTPAPPYSSGAMARDALSLVESVGWTERVHVVGVSLGGMIAQEFVLGAWKGLVASLTLVSTHAGRVRTPVKGMVRVPYIASLNGLANTRATVDLMFPKEWLDQVRLGDGRRNRDWIMELFETRNSRVPVPRKQGSFGQLCAALSHYVDRERLMRIRGIPVFVATGTEDHLVDPVNSEYLAEVLEARIYRVFVGAGHSVIAQCSNEFNLLLKGFVEEVEAELEAELERGFR
ncbi:hypothetical protein HDU79_003183 [Rhizoclosmatium sp. JEL0117]|nr:hypothetical protein HDU79_003183 [Rhizoclosmatium sp. JEL0117]